jgi:sulfur carrier protein
MTSEPQINAIVVMVNGVEQPLPGGSSAQDLVVALGLDGRPVAVELNEQVVPRAELADRVLQHDDRLEIVTLVGGG